MKDSIEDSLTPSPPNPSFLNCTPTSRVTAKLSAHSSSKAFGKNHHYITPASHSSTRGVNLPGSPDSIPRGVAATQLVLIRIPKSLPLQARDLTLQWRVGSEGTIFYVHPGVILPFQTSALYARMHGSWKETSSDVVDLSDFDEHTIECALSYFYAVAHKLGPKLEHGAKEESHMTFVSEHVHTDGSEDGNMPDKLTKDVLTDRPLTPIENWIKPMTRAVLLAATVMTPSPTKDLPQSLATEALTHAKVYIFAHVYQILELEDFALHRLAKVLIVLQDREFEMLPQLAEAIRVICCKTPKDCNNTATNLMSHFVATRFNWLIGDHLYALMAEGGDFAKDVSYKLALRLSVNPLKVKVGELKREISALKFQCAKLRGELNLLRKEPGGIFR